MRGENRAKKGFRDKRQDKRADTYRDKTALSDIKNARLITSGGFYASVLSW